MVIVAMVYTMCRCPSQSRSEGLFERHSVPVAVSGRRLDAEQRGRRDAKERMNEKKRDTHASRPEIQECGPQNNLWRSGHKGLSAETWPCPCTFHQLLLFPSTTHPFHPFFIMIEVVCNDRLGKKVRVKCKYVLVTSTLFPKAGLGTTQQDRTGQNWTGLASFAPEAQTQGTDRQSKQDRQHTWASTLNPFIQQGHSPDVLVEENASQVSLHRNYNAFQRFQRLTSNSCLSFSFDSGDDTVGDLKKLIAAQTGTNWEKIVLKKWYCPSLLLSKMAIFICVFLQLRSSLLMGSFSSFFVIGTMSTRTISLWTTTRSTTA